MTLGNLNNGLNVEFSLVNKCLLNSLLLFWSSSFSHSSGMPDTRIRVFFSPGLKAIKTSLFLLISWVSFAASSGVRQLTAMPDLVNLVHTNVQFPDVNFAFNTIS